MSVLDKSRVLIYINILHNSIFEMVYAESPLETKGEKMLSHKTFHKVLCVA